NGGTNTNTLGPAGTVAYSNGTNYAFTAVGSTGQALVSGGTGSPTWTTGTLTLGQNFTTAGSAALTLTTGGVATNATFPTGNITVADLGSTQTFGGAKTFSDITISDTNVPFSG